MENENSNLIDQQQENIVVPEQVLQNESKRKPFFKSFVGRLIKLLLFFAFLFFAVFYLPIFLQRVAVPIAGYKPGFLSDNNSEEIAESKEILEKTIDKLDNQLKEFIPKNTYIIINSTDNEFTLKKGDEVIRKGKCSTGSYLMLENDKQQKWLFKTPKGRLTVKSKRTDPVWTKPDWAFVEEGLPIPGPNHPSRIEEGVLGDYALSLGNGYMIHGTLWQRYLGLAVTHGCVRLNDADLEVVYKNLSKGSNVYIY